MKNNIITIYGLIGLIKDGKAPKNIKYNDEIFEYDKRYNYISQDGNLLFGDYIYELYYTPSTLNKIVEVSPEKHDEWEVIEECLKKDFLDLTLDERTIELYYYVRDLIKNQKYLKDKLDDKDVL